MSRLTKLRTHLQEISDLQAIGYVLEWDQLVYMPQGGSDARSRHIGLTGRLLHEKRASDDLAEMVGEHAGLLDEDSQDGALLRHAKRISERARRVPAELQEEITRHCAAMYDTWTKARAASDFAMVQPLLEKNVELSQRYAACFEVDHPADAFIDEHDPGMTAESIRTLFAHLREDLVPIARTLIDAPQPDAAFLSRSFNAEKQLQFGAAMAKAIGYDFDRGRQDLTAHPFMIRFSGGDIRITTRVTDDPTQSLFGTIHEAGHALYEQGINPAYDGSPLGGGTSTGVHESQSRLWENLVGRSRAFWDAHFAAMKDTFGPNALGDISVEAFHRAINRVRPNPIRVSSDEVTYNLHVMVRFDLELAILGGELAVADLPEAWNARMKSDLGLEITDDAQGCLQDVHWYCMPFGGAFQGYTLGNVMSAQFYEAAQKALPNLEKSIRQGDVSPLRGWLTENIYQHGGRYTPDEIVKRATGKELSTSAFVRYLKDKYGELYGITL